MEKCSLIRSPRGLEIPANSPDAEPAEVPYRGSDQFTKGEHIDTCSWSGILDCFRGEEQVILKENPVYLLMFHGGNVHD